MQFEGTKETRLREVLVNDDASISVRFGLLIKEGDAVLGSRTHEARFWPGDDLLAGLAAISSHLSETGMALATDGVVSTDAIVYPEISQSDIARVTDVSRQAWTEELIAEHRSRQAAVAEREAAEAAAAEAAQQAAEEAEQKKFDDAVAVAVARTLAKAR